MSKYVLYYFIILITTAIAAHNAGLKDQNYNEVALAITLIGMFFMGAWSKWAIDNRS